MKHSGSENLMPEAVKADNKKKVNTASRAKSSVMCKKVEEAQAKLMLDSTPLMCAMWNESGELIDCNMEMLRLLKIANKKEVLPHFFDFSPQYQPDGTLSKERGLELVRQTLESGQQRFLWEYQTTDGERLPTETFLVRIKWENGFRILAYSRDLRELQEAKEQERLAEERTAVMLNTLPLATYLISSNLQVIDCNEAAVRLFRANDKAHVISSFLEDFSPEYQPDGTLSSQKARDYMQQAFDEGSVDFDWTHKMNNGEFIPTQISLIRVPWNNQGYMLCAYAQDLREVKKAEQEIRQRATYMKTVNKIAEWLLSSNPKNAEGQMERAIEFLARNMNIDGIKVWMNTEQDGELYYSLYKSWPLEEAAKWPGKYAYNNLPFWKDAMLDIRSVNTFVSDLPRAEQTRINKHEIKSVLAIPLLVGDVLWGFICFEDHHTERVFTDTEEHLLSSASSLIVSTIVRNRAVRQMQKNNRELRKKSYLLSSVNRVAELILGSEKSDFPQVIQRALKLLGESVGSNRASLWILENEDAEASPRSKRLTGWQRGMPFAETEHDVELKIYDYVPEWDVPVGELQDVEIPIDKMNGNLKRFSMLQGTKTLLLIPLVMQDSLWGYVGFSYEENNHRSTDEERSILRSGSMMIAGGIMRQEMTENLERVEGIASTDHLTGLLTRNSFLQKSEAMFTEYQQEKKPFSLLFLDIDHFKVTNDLYGHSFGDEVLVRFAEIIKKSTRQKDICCRYGGEEVVIVLADIDAVITEKVGQRILHEVRNAIFESNKDFRFTVSIGLFSEVPGENDDLQAFLEKADSALYAAKNQGRNRLVNPAALSSEDETAAEN